MFEEAEASFRSQIKVLEEDVARQQVSKTIYLLCDILNETCITTASYERVDGTISPRARIDVERNTRHGYADCSTTSWGPTTSIPT